MPARHPSLHPLLSADQPLYCAVLHAVADMYLILVIGFQPESVGE